MKKTKTAKKTVSRKSKSPSARRPVSRKRAFIAPKAMSPDDPIQHVVVLMLENRSFDHMLGSLKSFYPQLRGIDPASPGTNSEGSTVYSQTPDALFLLPYGVDPKHEWPDVVEQLTFNAPCGGFVHNFLRSYPDKASSAPQVMSYFDRTGDNRLPVLHTLAESYAICDQWYSSVPGPTWPNRFFVHSATSQGWVYMPSGLSHYHTYDQDTIYDRLTEGGVSWKIYFDDIPQTLMLANIRKSPNRSNLHTMSVFYADAKGAEAAFPQYSFIEPCYFGGYESDQHPPANVMDGEALIARVYNALRANEALWQKTLLVVLYDEHGGFFDPLTPPAAVSPDGLNGDGFNFDQLGLRVPALLISPYAPKDVITTAFDHTSLLRYVIDKWGLRELTARSKAANSIKSALLTTARTDTPGQIDEPSTDVSTTKAFKSGKAAKAAKAAKPVPPNLNDLQSTLLAFTQVLEPQIKDTPAKKAARLTRSIKSNEDHIAVGRERVLKFLKKKK